MHLSLVPNFFFFRKTGGASPYWRSTK